MQASLHGGSQLVPTDRDLLQARVAADRRQRGDLLGEKITSWSQSQTPLLGTAVGEFQHMLQRVKKEDVDAMVEESKQDAAPVAPAADTAATSATTWNDTADALAAEPLAETCTIDDFVKIDLRVARIINAEHVPEARKLLKLTVSLGGDVQRTVFAGIKAAYEPEKLIGRLVVIVANSVLASDEVRLKRRDGHRSRPRRRGSSPTRRRLRRQTRPTRALK
ncbi:MAG: hypothetical protein U0892_06320 [Pirellulales bacterium]